MISLRPVLLSSFSKDLVFCFLGGLFEFSNDVCEVCGKNDTRDCVEETVLGDGVRAASCNDDWMSC